MLECSNYMPGNFWEKAGSLCKSGLNFKIDKEI